MQPIEMKRTNLGKENRRSLPLDKPTDNSVHETTDHRELYLNHRHFLYLQMDPQYTFLAYHRGSRAAQHKGTPGKQPRTRSYEHNRYWKSSCPSLTNKQLRC